MKRKIEFKKRQKNPWISFRFWDKLFMYCVKTVQSYTSFSQRHQGWINIKKTKIDQHGNVAWPEQKNEFYEKKKKQKKKRIPNLLHFTKPAEHFLNPVFSNSQDSCQIKLHECFLFQNKRFRQWCNHVNFERAFSSARINQGDIAGVSPNYPQLLQVSLISTKGETL